MQGDSPAGIELAGGLHADAPPCVVVHPTPKQASVADSRRKRRAARHEKSGRRPSGSFQSSEPTVYPVDKTLGLNAGQGAVFNVAAKETVDAFLEGYNGTILCYGQTGAGKTYTLSGNQTSNDYDKRGLMPRTLEYIFECLASSHARPNGYQAAGGEGEAHGAAGFTVRVSYLELYKEQLFDLLDSSLYQQQSLPAAGQDTELHGSSSAAAFGYSSSARQALLQGPARLEIVESKNSGVHARGCNCPVVPTLEAALSCLFEGETNRVIAEHQLNAVSSRSHCIFTVHLERRSEEGEVVRSKLRLVDLAGSERVRRTKSEGATLQEAKYINKSLAFFEQVVVALGESRRDHVPYRSSKLTHLLKDCIGGNCLTVMIANIWPAEQHIDQTISTLAFANRMRRIKCSPAMLNIVMESAGRKGKHERGENKYGNTVSASVLKRYKHEVNVLREELIMRDMVAGGGTVGTAKDYRALTSAERARLQDRINDFVGIEDDAVAIVGANNEWQTGDDEALVGLGSMREVSAVFNMMREMIWKERNRAAHEISKNSETVQRDHETKLTASHEPKTRSAEAFRKAQARAAADLASKKKRYSEDSVNKGGIRRKPSSIRDSLENEDANEAGIADNSKNSPNSEESAPRDLDQALQQAKGTPGGTSPVSPHISKQTYLPPRNENQSANRDALTEATRAEAYARYQTEIEVGRDHANRLRDNKHRYSEIKSKLKGEIDAANEAKNHIDSILIVLEEHRSRREEDRESLPAGLRGVLAEDEASDMPQNSEGEPDEKETALLKELKEHKRKYRMHAAAVPSLKNKLTFLKGAVSRSREELVRSFQVWWEGENVARSGRASTANGGKRPSRSNEGIAAHNMNISASTSHLEKSSSRAAFLRAKRSVYSRR